MSFRPRRRKYAHRIPQLSDKDYHDKLTEQGGTCALCPRKPREGGRRFAGDHDHRTGKRRGVCCPTCNFYVLGAIDRFRIDPERIVAYYKKYS